MICPNCLTLIYCGTVRLANLEKQHCRKKVCQENKAKHAKELQNQKQKRNGSLLNFFKGPKATHIPSKVSNIAPIHSNSLALEKVANTGVVTSINTQSEGALPPPKVTPEPASSSFLERFLYLINNLPEIIPEASDYDALAIFSAIPCDFNDTSIPSGELWEEVVNKTLKFVFGWGIDGNLDDIICQGRKGLDGLADFVKYFIVKRGVDEALFEGKLSYLMTALEEKYTHSILHNTLELMGAAYGATESQVSTVPWFQVRQPKVIWMLHLMLMYHNMEDGPVTDQQVTKDETSLMWIFLNLRTF